MICSPDLYPKLVARTATLTSLVEIFCVQTILRDFGFLNEKVKVSGLGSHKQITTYAFQNNGSDATLCPRGLLEESGVERESTDFRLTTVNHEGKEYGRRASLKIEALDGKTKFTLDQVLTTERLPIGEKHFTNNRELRKWPHLDGIYLPQVDERKVSILIGSNRPDIIDNNSEIRRRTKGQSYAVNTPLG